MTNKQLIKRFYGLADPLDEYKVQTAFHLGNRVFVPLFLCSVLLGLLGLACSKRFPDQVALGLPLVLEFVLLSFFQYLIISSQKNQLLVMEKEELSQTERKRLPWTGLLAGLYFGFSMYFWGAVIDYWTEGIGLVSSLLNPRTILSGCISGVLFGGACQAFLFYRLRQGNAPLPSVDPTKKESPLLTKVIKRFYGIRGPFDEWRQKEVDRIGGLALVYLSYLLIVGNAVAFLVALRFPKVIATLYPILLLLAVFACQFLIGREISKNGLLDYQLEELTPDDQVIKPFLSLYVILGVAALSALFAAVADLFSLNQSILSSLLHGKVLFFGGFMGLFAGIALSMITAIRKCEQDCRDLKEKRQNKK